MSDHIPFHIQSQIIQRLPVQSLVQFRSVSKQWKSFIDDPEFIKTYHVNHPNPLHHLLISYKFHDDARTNTSIIDNNTFPQQKFTLTAPNSLSLLRNTKKLSSVDGLLCFYGDVDFFRRETHPQKASTKMAVIWNPSIRKSVGIVIPRPKAMDVVGFAVCPDTSDPKLVRISVYARRCVWEVQVFTLSTRVWKTVYTGAPFKSSHFSHGQVFVDGVIYFSAYYFDRRSRSRCHIIISFDLKSEKFGEVGIPERLAHILYLDVAKVNDSLGLLEYREGEESVCGVWTRKDGANKPFTKIYTIKINGKKLYRRVLGFRNNGEVVITLDGDDCTKSSIEVYEPSSGHINGVGIIQNWRGYFNVGSYMETLTLLLLDESDSIIY